MDEGFPKNHRLLKRKDFRLVYDTGTPYRNTGFHLFVRKRQELGPTRLGITITRTAGKAAVRNRIRRRVREAFRLAYEELEPGFDLVVNCRGNLATMTGSKLDRLFKGVLNDARLAKSIQKGLADKSRKPVNNRPCGKQDSRPSPT